jgi:Adenosine deaminase
MREGDRIGHGMALGVDPREWVKRAGRLPMPCEDRLFDLAWEWDWYGREGIDPAVGRRSLVEREIYRLSEWVFGAALPPYEVERLATDLLDAKLLRRIGFPNGPRPDDVGNDPFGRARRLLRYLTDRSLFLRGRQIEWVEPAAEGEVLAALQAGLRGKVAARGICVEVNPTSNLLIGDLHDLTRHPLWRLRPPRGDGDSPSVSVCIGSDDPITFGTDLRQEYQFLHDALTLAGFSDEAARHWLNRTRASGLETRFTVPRTDGLNLDSFRDLARPVVPSRL